MWLGLAVCLEANNCFKWETVKYNGVDYVTLRSVKDFYYFDDIRYGVSDHVGKVRVLRNGGASRQPTMQDEWCFVCSESS